MLKKRREERSPVFPGRCYCYPSLVGEKGVEKKVSCDMQWGGAGGQRALCALFVSSLVRPNVIQLMSVPAPLRSEVIVKLKKKKRSVG